MLPYSREMMIVDISLDCVISQRPLWDTLVRLPRPLSLMFPYSRIVMIVLRPSLYGVVSDGRVLGLFVPLPPAVFTGFPREQTFRWKRVLAVMSFSVLCSSCFTLVPKHLDSCSTFHKAVVIQGLSPHTLFLGTKGWILPRPLLPMRNRGP